MHVLVYQCPVKILNSILQGEVGGEILHYFKHCMVYAKCFMCL